MPNPEAESTPPPIRLQYLKRPLQWGLGAALALGLVSLSWPNRYQSVALILPAEGKTLGGLGGLSSAAAAFGVSMPGGDGADANYVDILASRPLMEKLVTTEYTFKAATWRFGTPKEHTETLQAFLHQKNLDRAVKALAGRYRVARDLKSKVISISVETTSPELSRDIVRQATHLLEAFVQDKGRTRGGFKASFAEARLKEARGELAQVESGLRSFLDRNRNYQTSVDPSVRLEGMRLENEYKLRQQLLTTLALNREQALLEEKNDMPILNVMDPGRAPEDKSGPGRGGLILAAFALVTATTWLWTNRTWVGRALMGPDGVERES